jgi:hypothetical protein
MMVFTKSFSLEMFHGIHDFRTDEIRMALYEGDAPLDADTTEYTVDGEIVGTGYDAGGAAVFVTEGYPQLVEGCGAVRFDRAQWPFGSTFSYRKLLIYNASKDGRAIFVADLSIDRGPENASHFIEMPQSARPLLFMNRGVA